MSNLIAISGKIGAGKDTVMKMLLRQELYDLAEAGHISSQSIPALQYIGITPTTPCNSWKPKKFAAKLKQFVADIIGVDVALLDDQDFKKSNLGPEWARMVKVNEQWFDGQINYKGYRKEPMTVRDMLIAIGDGMRNVVHPDIWVNALFSELEDKSKWIIHDMRYINELERVKKLCGYNIRVNRKDIIHIDHISETGLDDAKFDYTIENNKDLTYLNGVVKEIYYDIKQRIANTVGRI